MKFKIGKWERIGSKWIRFWHGSLDDEAAFISDSLTEAYTPNAMDECPLLIKGLSDPLPLESKKAQLDAAITEWATKNNVEIEWEEPLMSESGALVEKPKNKEITPITPRNPRALPGLVAKLAAIADIWVVGSTVSDGPAQGRDVDIIVPFNDWPKVALLAASEAGDNLTTTSFGGLRVVKNGQQFDIWPDTLERLAVMPYFRGAWNARTGIVIGRVP